MVAYITIAPIASGPCQMNFSPTFPPSRLDKDLCVVLICNEGFLDCAVQAQEMMPGAAAHWMHWGIPWFISPGVEGSNWARHP